MSWRTQGCYCWRTDRPGRHLLFRRHFAYVGETSYRAIRDKQHLHGERRPGYDRQPPKSWADLNPKVYPMPCLFPYWRKARLVQEQLWILLLFPVYNVKGNRWNPRRITPFAARAQRAQRDAIKRGLTYR